jgi:hypothetical protein
MSVNSVVRVLPMKTAGTQHLIERTYREGGQFQWVRETMINAMEATATRVEYGVEWQAVESMGVYRRVIADNGTGMTADQLVEFFNTFGGGGKPIGGEHENFGVGAKTSLLPWNPYGVTVVSWVDGDASMIWVQRDPSSGEYGLRLMDTVDAATGVNGTLDEVYGPFDDEMHGCDWSKVKPDWIEDHGTVIILLGSGPSDDTVLGDPGRNEGDIKGISSFLNRRIWAFGEVGVVVDELRTQDRSKWPRTINQAHGAATRGGVDLRTNVRTIRGARHFIEYPDAGETHGRLADKGTVELADGTEVDWYLWDGVRPAVQSYAAVGGYIAALYKNELFDITFHHSTYRSFGVSESGVRANLWLIIRPPMLGQDGGKHGVYPRTDRNALLLKGGPNAGGPLPINDWAGAFADNMPDAIVAAIKRQRGGEPGTLDDQVWRQRLADRFGARWRIVKLRAQSGGRLTVTPVQPGGEPVTSQRPIRKTRSESSGSSEPGGARGSETLGSTVGGTPAASVKVGGGIPKYRFVHDGEIEAGMLAAYVKTDPISQGPMVLINVDHPVLRAEVEHWQAQYADHHAEEVVKEVLAVYGQIAVAKVAHSEYLKSVIPSKVVEDSLRSEAALTMSLLGLMAEEAVIAPRLGGKFAKRHSAA